MDADELDKMCKEFNEFMKKRKENGERIGVMPQILMHEELIDTLVAQGNSLRQIHEYLKDTGQITSHYPYFWKVYKSLKGQEKLAAKPTTKPTPSVQASEELPEVQERRKNRKMQKKQENTD